MEYDANLQNQYLRSHELIGTVPIVSELTQCSEESAPKCAVIVHPLITHHSVVHGIKMEDEKDVSFNGAKLAEPGNKRKRRVIKIKFRGPNNTSRFRNKAQRELGEDYEGRIKINNKWQNISREGRRLKSRCNCSASKWSSKILCETLTDEERESIFKSFWKISWKEKRVYIRMLVNIKPVARRRTKNETPKRSNTLELHLKCKDRYVRVCRKMFLNTLCITEWALKNWIHI